MDYDFINIFSQQLNVKEEINSLTVEVFFGITLPFFD